MKQLLVCISLFCSTFTFGLTWGVLEDFVDTTVRGQVRYPYLIEHVLENKPIRVYVYNAAGIINLMDIARQKIRGGAVGWRSFCEKPGYQYVQGTPVDKGPYFISAAQRGAKSPRDLTVWTPS